MGSGGNDSLQVGVQSAVGIQPSLAASLAVPVLDVAFLVAGSLNSLNVSSLSVGSGGNDSLQVGVQSAVGIQPSLAASLAVPVLDVAFLVAGSLNSLNVSSLSVGSGGNDVLQVGDLSQQLVGPSGAAVLAVPVLDITFLVAGSVSQLNVDDAVGDGGDNVLEVGDLSQSFVSPDGLTVGAVPVSNVTGSVAGSVNSLNGDNRMILEGDNVLLVQGHAGAFGVIPAGVAVLAVPVLNVTGAAAGSLNGLHVLDGVSSGLVGQLAAVHAVSVAGVEVLVLAHGLGGQDDLDVLEANIVHLGFRIPNHVVAVAVSSILDVGRLVQNGRGGILAIEDQAFDVSGNLNSIDVVGAVVAINLKGLAGPSGISLDSAAPVVSANLGPHPVVLEVNGDVVQSIAATLAGLALSADVAQSGNIFLSNQGLAAVSADGASGLTGRDAGSGHSRQIGHILVSALGGENTPLLGSNLVHGILSGGHLQITSLDTGAVVKDDVAGVRRNADGPNAVLNLGHSLTGPAGVAIGAAPPIGVAGAPAGGAVDGDVLDFGNLHISTVGTPSAADGELNVLVSGHSQIGSLGTGAVVEDNIGKAGINLSIPNAIIALRHSDTGPIAVVA